MPSIESPHHHRANHVRLPTGLTARSWASTPHRRRRVVSSVAIALLVLMVGAHVATAQQAETESARVLAVGAVEGGAGFEFQTSAEGSESALPVFVEGGIARRLELVVEQVAYVGQRPKVGATATGPGDLEVTLVGLAVTERPRFPAVAFAAELKAPVARNVAIGTGKVDVAGYLVPRHSGFERLTPSIHREALCCLASSYRQ